MDTTGKQLAALALPGIVGEFSQIRRYESPAQCWDMRAPVPERQGMAARELGSRRALSCDRLQREPGLLAQMGASQSGAPQGHVAVNAWRHLWLTRLRRFCHPPAAPRMAPSSETLQTTCVRMGLARVWPGGRSLLGGGWRAATGEQEIPMLGDIFGPSRPGQGSQRR